MHVRTVDTERTLPYLMHVGMRLVGGVHVCEFLSVLGC